jgi:hypothetical protein
VRSVQIIKETVRVGEDLNLRFSMFAHTYIHNVDKTPLQHRPTLMASSDKPKINYE